MVLDHSGIVVPKDRFEAVVAWYEATLKPLGYAKKADFGVAVGFADADRFCDWWVSAGGEGGRVSDAGTHHAFRAKDRKLVDAFYEAAVAAGGADNGKPGLRPHYHPDYYGGFVRDPMGNNIEAVCHEKSAE